MKTLGECLTDRELEDMMKLAHVDDDGKIDYEGIPFKYLLYITWSNRATDYHFWYNFDFIVLL